MTGNPAPPPWRVDGDTLLDRDGRVLATIHEPSVAGLLQAIPDLFKLAVESAAGFGGWRDLHRARIAIAKIAEDPEALARERAEYRAEQERMRAGPDRYWPT